MANMDELLPELLSFPPHPAPQIPLSDKAYDDLIRDHIAVVKKMGPAKLLQPTSGGEQALSVINPAMNSISYTFILIATINAQRKGNKSIDGQFVWEKLTEYLSSYDPRQIRYVGKEFTDIIDHVAATASAERASQMATGPIRDALLRLDPSGTVMTHHHHTLVQLALESGNLNSVTPILDKFILYFPGNASQPKPKHLCDMSLSPVAYITPGVGLTEKLKPLEVLEYFYYAGMIYLGLQRFEQAFDMLESAVTYPAKDGVSKIMVESYKKWALVGVLLEGKLPTLPKSTSAVAAKNYHILAKPYETLGQIFENASAARLKSEADAGHQLWHSDRNLGLVLHVLGASQKFQIRNLANIYSKISVPEIYNLTTSGETGNKLPSVQAAADLVRDMINRGELDATLSFPPVGNQILTFTAGGPLDETATAQNLALATQRIQMLAKEVKQTDRILTHDKEYIKYVQKLRKSAKGGANGDQGIAGTDMDWNDMVEDEDIMGF